MNAKKKAAPRGAALIRDPKGPLSWSPDPKITRPVLILDPFAISDSPNLRSQPKEDRI